MKGIILLCYLLLFAGSRLCNGRGSVWAAVRCCWLFWGCLHRPAPSFSRCSVSGPAWGSLFWPSAFSVWQAQSLASSTKPSSSASGLWLSSILLDIVESELCIRLGLRQLPTQAVRRRSRLCPECRRGPCVHLRLHGRRLHQFHHPLHRVSLLPHEPHRRRLRLQFRCSASCRPAGAAGGPRRQGRADPECEESEVLFPLRDDAHGGLSLLTDERGIGPAGLVRTHFRVLRSFC